MRPASNGPPVNRQLVVPAFGPPQVLRVVPHAPLPEPGPGEVRIRVEASSILSTDVLVRKGLYPLLKERPPFVLGYDFVGIVEKLGPGVTRWRVGDRVADLPQTGGHADYVCRPAARLLAVPPDADAAEAACLLLSGMTAYQLLTHAAAVRPGQRILVHGGAGAVGSLLVQLGRHAGADVVATASAPKLAFVRHLGAVAHDYRAPDLEAQLRQAAGAGFDAVFDAVGIPSFRRSFGLLHPTGVLVTYGTFSLGQALPQRTPLRFLRFGLNYALWMATLAYWNYRPGGRRARFFGIVDSQNEHPARFQADLTTLFGLLRAGHLWPHVAGRLAPTEVVRGHEALEAGQVCGQLVLVLAAPPNEP